MFLSTLSLHNFRSYKKSTFNFVSITIIIGPNTAGKTNLCEAIFLLATGKSFRTEKDAQMIQFNEDLARVQGEVIQREEKLKLEVMLAQGSITPNRFSKKYLVNGIGKRLVDFTGLFPVVLFSPEELDIVSRGPSLRRKFLDDILEQIDREYRLAKTLYEKALKQRNALLQLAKETGRKDTKQFIYWDQLLITNGEIITKKREAILSYINQQKKEVFTFTTIYDHSIISEERLAQYKDAEVATGITLVGPHRDDFKIFMENSQDIRFFGSRGQQRLVVLQLKILQIAFIAQRREEKPLLLLDDIFSELDSGHIQLVLDMIGNQQTILTTTHEEFIKHKSLEIHNMIKLQ
jgi:DNA replication and repair protein RecF